MENNDLESMIKGFIANEPEPEIDKEYFELEDKFKAMFGHGIPREQFPISITEEKIKEAMRKCIELKEDKLYELLDIKFINGVLY